MPHFAISRLHVEANTNKISITVATADSCEIRGVLSTRDLGGMNAHTFPQTPPAARRLQWEMCLDEGYNMSHELIL